ncbi:TrkH family potassium uptake protein [Clostridium botulinum]|uniref:Trk family potassium uptake protein n=3 Tax=Clostridium botulinum TaxID=1491 RepID=A0A846HU85_CLOBO|nr:TrkH family potassium uptake protein [Clostridium botulinum]AJD27434.1 potassium uptake, TrkH family protein [Clostridium botulinum CDC_297]EPS49788.1 potassium uptake protein, TrkH family [Clostridium botulinum A1 str. CFSAN002368]ACQ54713.1 potassium uptake protein, TrkH family [Clostridium botulinum Ba4 str. 657]AJE10369.1 potassium uptake, TrkH family protein [Clostridium botulinum CDC_1436]APR00303.1 potassium uptake, TrkH family protein [Clostridium botulinum]
MKIPHMRRRFTPVQILAIGFAIVIFVGAILLSLPISSQNGQRTPFLDCLFTSTSAVCVTGLIVVDTGTHWTYFGKTVIMLLIEIGGLGFMSFATLLALLLGKKITLKERLVMQEALNTFNIQGLVKLAKYILLFTLSIQGGGALLLSTQFIPRYGLAKGVYYSIFHSISAFCNAGFDLFGNFSSLTTVYNNPVIVLVIAFLIIIGGLGFYVWHEIYHYKGHRKLSTHSKLVLWATFLLLVVGTILMFIFESRNPGTMANMTFGNKILSSFFAAVTPRTAGFNSISTSDMTMAGKFLTIILMFIGGASGSTAGGIKITTAGVLIMTVVCVVRGKQDTEINKKRISKEIVYRALAIAIISLTLVITVTMILSITEVKFPFEYYLYEATSAFATVGITLGLTTKLSTIGKIVILLTMYVGRVGPLTLAIAFARKLKNSSIKYPEEKILVG